MLGFENNDRILKASRLRLIKNLFSLLNGLIKHFQEIICSLGKTCISVRNTPDKDCRCTAMKS